MTRRERAVAPVDVRAGWSWTASVLSRAASGSTVVALRLAESATLASAATVRSLVPTGRAPHPARGEAATVTQPDAVTSEPPRSAAEPLDEQHPAEQSVDQSAEEPVEQSVDQSAEEPVEQLAEQSAEQSPSVEVDDQPLDEPPLDDQPAEDVAPAEDLEEEDEPLVPLWDQLSLPRIRGRLPRLSLEDLRSLHEYEGRHGARPQVVSMLANRIRRLEDADGDRPLDQDTGTPQSAQ